MYSLSLQLLYGLEKNWSPNLSLFSLSLSCNSLQYEAIIATWSNNSNCIMPLEVTQLADLLCHHDAISFLLWWYSILLYISFHQTITYSCTCRILASTIAGSTLKHCSITSLPPHRFGNDTIQPSYSETSVPFLTTLTLLPHVCKSAVDFAIGLLNSVFNLPKRQVMFLEEFE